jgi:uncharacterized membrane protein YqgA involved in biofilm formation
MIGLGTLVNMGAIIFGSAIGIIIKGGLKQKYQETVMNALGLAVMFIGISGALQGLFTISEDGLHTANVMLMIVSLALGGFLGELIDIEAKLDKMGEFIKKALKVKGEKGKNFVEGFVSSSLLFCIGAMAIIGSLKDGLSGDASMLFAKGFIDGTVAIFFASTFGIGVFFSILPLGLYQGAITLSAKYVEPYLSDRLISNISFIGSILIFGIGINMLFGKKIKCGNLLPAVLIPVAYEILMNLIQ